MGSTNPGTRHMSRRVLLAGAAGSAAAFILAACGGRAATDAPTSATGGGTTATAPASTGTMATAAVTTAPAGATTTGGAIASTAPPVATPAGTTGQVIAAASPTPLKTSGTVTLEVWAGGTYETGPGDIIENFQRAYPNIKANYTRFVNDDTGNTKLDTALQGGAPIDVYVSFDVPRMSQRIKSGLAEDITPYIAADPAVKQWVDATPGIFKYQGKLYSLPTVSEPNVVLINKKMFDAAGVKVPEKWTTDEFRTIAQRVSTGSGDKRAYGMYAPPDIARLILGPDYWYKNDGMESNFDHPAFRQYLEFWKGMLDEKSAFPWTEVLAQNLRVYQQNVFLNGQAATWVTATWVARYINDKANYPHDFVTSFAPLPNPPGVAQPYNQGGINNWVVMHPKAKNKEAAWAFMRYWLTVGGQYVMTKGGKAPAWPGVDAETAAAGILGPDRAQLYDLEAFRRVVLDPSPRLVTDTITTASAEIRTLNQQQTDRVLIGELKIDEWVTTMKKQADDLIKKAKQ